MAKLAEWQLDEIIKRCRLVIPDVEYAPEESWTGVTEYEFEDTCSCYSEWTTEACSFRVWVKGTFDESDRDKAWKKRRELEGAVEAWVHGNLSWSGCSNCSGEDYGDGDDNIHIIVHLYPRKVN